MTFQWSVRPGDKAWMPAQSIQRSLQRDCDLCSKKQQSQLAAGDHLSEDRLENVASPLVNRVLSSPGRPLGTSVRAFMEPRLGQDLSQVKVHSDSLSAASAREVSAAAYTVGSHMVFGEGQYNPISQSGSRLIAHEIIHTLQQGPQSKGRLTGSPMKVSAPSDPSEVEAESAADSVVSGQPNDRSAFMRPHGPGSGPVMLMRQEAQGSYDLAETASPFLARAIGSMVIDGFETGKSDISAKNISDLKKTASRISTLRRKYSFSRVRVIGHTDAIGKEGDNLGLGQRRADSVSQALEGMGVSPDVIDTESKGESELAVKTGRAEPRNRRVEIKFDPVSTTLGHALPGLQEGPQRPLTWDSFTKPKERPDLNLPPPKYEDPGKSPNLPPDFWKPIPPPIRTPQKSPLDAIYDYVVDPVVKKTTSWLPKGLQNEVRDLARSAVKSGITKGLDAVLEAKGLDTQARDAIKKAVEAAIQTNGSPFDLKSETEGSPWRREPDTGR
jgi:outer membrane protein OmpA-like peptidoglycan-associated protein